MFVVHGIAGSPYVRSPLIALEEKGLPWRLAAIPFGANRTPEWAAERQPFGKIPAFEHDGFELYETQAILRYIDRIAPGPSLTPADIREAARMDQLLNITDCYVAGPSSGRISFPRLVAPMFGLPVDEESIAAAVPEAKKAVDEIARLLGDQRFMAGDAISLADVHLIPHLTFLPHTPEGRSLLAPHANLAAWIARMDARPSLAATSWDRLKELTAEAEAA